MHTPATPIIFVDGAKFNSLESFANHFSDMVLSGHRWNGNLDALNDILRGGFGTPKGGFRLVWLNAGRSKATLGYGETVRQLSRKLDACHPSNRAAIAAELAQAKNQMGRTVFDWLTEVIREHGPGGSESEDGVELELR